MIAPNEKFGIVAIRTNFVDHDVPTHSTYCGKLESYRELPVELSEHWQQWLGSIRTEEFQKANLILMSRGHSSKPRDLDGEDKGHQLAARRFYGGLLVSGSVRCSRSPLLLAGQHWGDKPQVRQFSQLSPPVSVPGTPSQWINASRLAIAAKCARAMAKLSGGGGYHRVFRAIKSFFNGMESADSGDRIHHFCRSIEGFILPTLGKTKRQFKSRSELYIGPQFHDLMDQIYDLRSAAEHLHDPFSLIESTSERQRCECFLTLAIIIEEIARHCISRFLLSPELHPWYADDSQIAELWKKNRVGQAALWGPPLDLSHIQKAIDMSIVSDHTLGL
jgi:hypothetical protein